MRSLQRRLPSLLAFAGLIALSVGCAEEKASLLPIVRDAATPAPAADSGGGGSDSGGAKSDAASTPSAECAGDTAPAGDRCGGLHCKETAAEIDEGKTASAACGKESEIAELCSTRANTVFAGCATSALGVAAMVKSCARGMLPEMSDACLDCYTASVTCTVTNCRDACSGMPNAAACISCRKEKNCYRDFYECAGYDDPT